MSLHDATKCKDLHFPSPNLTFEPTKNCFMCNRHRKIYVPNSKPKKILLGIWRSNNKLQYSTCTQFEREWSESNVSSFTDLNPIYFQTSSPRPVSTTAHSWPSKRSKTYNIFFSKKTVYAKDNEDRNDCLVWFMQL